MTDILQKISNIIYDYKENLTDSEYKELMEFLMNVNTKNQNDQIQDYADIQVEQHRNFYLHNSKMKRYFNFFYNRDAGLFVDFLQQTQRLKIGDKFLYSKNYDIPNLTINQSFATIKKIMKHYSIIEVNGYDKKISNMNLTKIYYYPLIEIY